MIGKLIINVLITLVGMAFLVRYFCYFDKKYEKYDKNDNSDKNEKGAGKISEKSKKPEMLEFSELKEYIKAKKKFFIISGVFFMVLCCAGTFFAKSNSLANYRLMKYFVYTFLLYMAAYTDIRKKLIPNDLIIAMIVARVPFLFAEVFYNMAKWQVVLKVCGLGFVMSAVVALVMMLISRGQMGGGDVKLLAVIGLYVGSTNVLTVMLFSFILSAVGGLGCMIIKKYKAKDTIPFAPFVFLGMLIYFVLICFVGKAA